MALSKVINYGSFKWESASEQGFSRYEVCREGFCREAQNKRVLIYSPKSDGTIEWNLWNDDNKRVRKLSHIIIAKVFIPNPNNLSFVRHVNKIRSDNRVENLYWTNKNESFNYIDLTKVTWVEVEPSLKLSKYWACREGYVKSKITGNIMGADKDNNGGYIRAQFVDDDGNIKRLGVHEVIRKTFILNPDPDNLKETDHINRIKDDNNADNLRNADRSMQILNQVVTKPRGGGRKVYQFNLQGEFIKEWDTITTAANALKIHRQDISKACNGTLKTTGGFIWSYADTYEYPGEDFRYVNCPEYDYMEASNYGRIKFSNGRITEGKPDGRGTKLIYAQNRETDKTDALRVHRLVKYAFSGRYDNKAVYHRNGTDNYPDNLRYEDET